MLYDLLFYRKSLPSHRRLSRSETLKLEPGLEQRGLVGSYLYYDCQSPFVERLCLENVLSASEHGATILNHAKVVGLLRDSNGMSGVEVQDVMSGETYDVKASIVINATGHWVDSLREMLGKSASTMIRRTKGIHLLTAQISRNAIVLFALADNRLFFVIPWQGYSLIGTTDTDYSGDLDSVEAEREDVTYLLTEVRRIFPSIDSQEIFYASAGLRALARSNSKRPSDVSRSHRLVDHEREDGTHGFISVLGGKITAYRAVAEQVVDLVCKKLGSQATCTTDQVPLPGAQNVTKQMIEKAANERGITVETVTHLTTLYGSRFTEVLDLLNQNPRGAQRICPHSPDILAQVQHAVENEGALTAEDFLLRRSALGLGPCLGLDALDHIADEMGSLLHWSQNERQKQMNSYRTRSAGRLRLGSGLQS
jgi:glycerol-3-phosphate dehydrogenase